MENVVTNDFQWEEIVGYDIIINKFFDILSKKNITNYTDMMIESSMVLLNNKKLLSK